MLRNRLKSMVNRFQGSYRQLYMMYLLIFGLPLIATVVLSETSAGVLERQVQSSATAITQQVQTTIDSRMRDISRLIDQINNHSTLRYILNLEGDLSNTERYMFVTVINDLRKQYAYNSIVDDLFIYMPGTDSIITTSTRCPSDFFYGEYFRYEDTPYDQWLGEYMGAFHEMSIVPAKAVYDGAQTRRMVSVLQTLPRGETWRRPGTLTMLVDEEWLVSQVVTARSIEGSEVFVVSPEGDIIFTSSKNKGQTFDVERFENGAFLTETVDGRDYQLSYTKSGEQDWYYVFRFPRDQFFALVDNLRLTMRTALLVVIAIGLALAGGLAYLNLVPVSNILNSMRVTDSKGMIDRLRRKISFSDLGTLMEETMKNSEAFTQQLPKLIENYVFKLIHGNKDVQTELSLLSEVLGFRFPSNVFAVICLKIYDSDEQQTLQIYRDTRGVLQEVQGQEDAGMNLYCTLATEDSIAVLVSFWAGQTAGYRELLEKRGAEILERLRAKTGKSLPAGVSMVVDNHEEIDSCYRQAVMCIAGTSDAGAVTFYADMACLVPPFDYSYPLETEKVLIGCVCTGDAKRMHKILDDIFLKHEQESRMSQDMVRCLKYDMLGTLYKCMQELHSDEEPQNQARLATIIRRAMQSDAILDIYECFIEAFENLCSHAYQSKHSHNDTLCDRIMEYIRENFTSPDMGLDMVARAFDIAPGYLSRFFKEQSGSNFLDFINKLRIEHAAYLLRTTEMSHGDVAVACGLSGAQSLNRIFNRILSLSPSVYRQMARDGIFDGKIIG